MTLTKLTLDVLSGYQRDMELAEKIPGLDVVVGGHTHSFLYSSSKPNPSNNEVEVSKMARVQCRQILAGSVPDHCEEERRQRGRGGSSLCLH